METSKERDARLYGQLPPRYVEYVHRIGHFTCEDICRMAELKAGQTVLDIGSGSGIAARRAAQRVCPEGHVLGIDISPGLVETAATLTPTGHSIEYRVMDAENLELADGSFDAVISYSAVFHFPNLPRAIAEMSRVLKPGGRLAVSYTSMRPEPGPELAAYYARQVAIRLLELRRPAFRAPDCLKTVADQFLPVVEAPHEPAWAKTRPGQLIVSEIEKAGFRDLETHWRGEDVIFDSPEEFFEAQVMISSDLRARFDAASPEHQERLRTDFLTAARDVQRRGGRLLYPFGAVTVAGVKPR